MKKYHILFIIFVVCSLGLLSLALYRSTFFESKRGDAAGFGVSPPEAKFGVLKPGETKTEKIMLVRSSAQSAIQIDTRLEAEETRHWFSVSPEGIYFSEGSYQTPVQLKVNVPEDAYEGDYSGDIYFYLYSSSQKQGVNINVGARVNIQLSVIDGAKKPVPRVIEIYDNDLYERYRGLIVVRNDKEKQTFYVHPVEKRMYYFDGSEAVKDIMSENGLGILDKNLEKIQVSLDYLIGQDSDLDGLPDVFETAFGSNVYASDTDGDSFNDREEILNNFSATDENFANIDIFLAQRLSGRILLQIENRGQAWYINPRDKKRYFLGDPDNAFYVLRKLSHTINDGDYNQMTHLE